MEQELQRGSGCERTLHLNLSGCRQPCREGKEFDEWNKATTDISLYLKSKIGDAIITAIDKLRRRG